MTGRTLAEKVWDEHVVHRQEGQPDLLFVDLHLVHEVTSAQAFEGLRLAGRSVRRPDLTLATADHNIPTVLGRPVVVRCVATNLDIVPEIADDEAAFVLAEARRIFGDDVSDAAEVG